MDQQPLYFEDLEAGYRVETPARTITEADIIAFAQLSDDHNPLHIDPDYAATTPFGQPIAHGLFILSIATGAAYNLGFLDGTVEAFVGMDWKFRAPVIVGDAVHVCLVVHRKRRVPGYPGGLVVFDVEILNQEDQVVQQGRWRILVRGRQASGRRPARRRKTSAEYKMSNGKSLDISCFRHQG